MKTKSSGRKSNAKLSAHAHRELNINRSCPSMPNGMTLTEYRQRSGRAFNGLPPCSIGNNTWLKLQPQGANTSGALSGLRASSYPNPVLAPPSAISDLGAN